MGNACGSGSRLRSYSPCRLSPRRSLPRPLRPARRQPGTGLQGRLLLRHDHQRRDVHREHRTGHAGLLAAPQLRRRRHDNGGAAVVRIQRLAGRPAARHWRAGARGGASPLTRAALGAPRQVPDPGGELGKRVRGMAIFGFLGAVAICRRSDATPSASQLKPPRNGLGDDRRRQQAQSRRPSVAWKCSMKSDAFA